MYVPWHLWLFLLLLSEASLFQCAPLPKSSRTRIDNGNSTLSAIENEETDPEVGVNATYEDALRVRGFLFNS